MAPWFTVPSRAVVRRAAVLADLRQRLEAARCTLRLIHRGETTVQNRELLDRLSDELRELESALDRLSTGQ